MGRTSIPRIAMAVFMATLLCLLLTRRFRSTVPTLPEEYGTAYRPLHTGNPDNGLIGDPQPQADLLDTRSLSARGDAWDKAISNANTLILSLIHI